MVTRYDRAALKATRTGEGFVIDSPVLSRVGVFEYRRADGTVRREYRPAAAVFEAAHLDSLYGKPITDGHHGLITGKSAKAKSIGTVLSKGRQDADNLVGDIVIHDTSSIDAGVRELSLGYTLELDETPGEWNGQRYDAVQKNLRVNHLALVPHGRAGNARLNLDSADAEIFDRKGDTMTFKKVRLDSGLEYDAAPEVVAAFDAARTQATAEKARADGLQAKVDGLQAKVDGHDAALKVALDTARADGVKAAQGRMRLEAEAKELGVEVKQDAKDTDIRVAVIKAVRGDAFDATGKSDTYIEVAYEMAVVDGKKGRKDGGQQRQAAHGTNQPARQDGADVSHQAAMKAYQDKIFGRTPAKGE